MKKWIISLLVLFSMSFSLIGCGSSTSFSSNLSNGQSLMLSSDTPVCSSKENVDKMISYVKNNNSSAINTMELQGEAKILSSGTKVNIIETGVVTEIEISNGGKWFAPNEVIK